MTQSTNLKLAQDDIGALSRHMLEYKTELSDAFSSFNAILSGLVGAGGAIQDTLIASSVTNINARAQMMYLSLTKISVQLNDLCDSFQKDIEVTDVFKP